MKSESAVSRRELLKQLGMAGAAALALPELEPRIVVHPHRAQARPGACADRCVKPSRVGDADRPVRANHSHRREWARRCRSARVRIHRSRAGGMARDVSRRVHRRSGRCGPGRAGKRGPAIRRPCTRRTGQRADLARADAVFCARARAHDSGHVLRSGIWRQRELRRLGSALAIRACA